ncbi:MAG: helix-turn-helix transcriptional regulator [Alphaproteobacteria bacterium]
MLHPVDIHVARRLCFARKAAGLSQDKLSALVGISFQQIQKYENAANRISASRLFQLAGALGVRVPYFFEGLEESEERIMAEAGLSRRALIGAVELDNIENRDIREALEAIIRVARKKAEF